MVANVYINTELAEGMLIHTKLPTYYIVGRYNVYASDMNKNAMYVDHVLPIPAGVAEVFIYTNTSNTDNLYNNLSIRMGSLDYRYENGQHILRVNRLQTADRNNGSWSGWNKGAVPVFTGYIVVTVGARRG